MRNPILVPTRDELVDENRKITGPWAKYISALGAQESRASASAGRVDLTDQAASIGTTSVPLQTVYTAAYRVSYYAEVTQAATTSSDITVTLAWTHGGKSFSVSGAALSGNTITTQQNAILTALVDGNTPITYSTTYNSTGATPMQYLLTVIVELIG